MYNLSNILITILPKYTIYPTLFTEFVDNLSDQNDMSGNIVPIFPHFLQPRQWYTALWFKGMTHSKVKNTFKSGRQGSCQDKCFLDNSWKNQSRLVSTQNCIYFEYQLALLALWMCLDTFQAKLAWLDQRKFLSFSRHAVFPPSALQSFISTSSCEIVKVLKFFKLDFLL